MLPPKVVIAILAFSSIQALAESDVTPNFSRHISHPGHDFIINYKVGENVTLSYALCKRFDHNSTDKTCQLTLESVSASGAVQTKTCSVPLLSKGQAYEVNHGKYKLQQVGEDAIVFIWKQSEVKERHNRRRRSFFRPAEFYQEHLAVNVVRMSDCNIRKIGVDVEGRDEDADGYVDFDDAVHKIGSVNVLSYDNGSFSLFLRNKEFCGADQRCSWTYDPELGSFTVTGGLYLPVTYEASVEIFPVKATPNSEIKAYLVSSHFLQDGAMTLISTEGKVLYDHSYSHSITEIGVRISLITVSIAHGNFGLCQLGMFKSKLECSLFDHAGNAKIGITIPFELVDVAMVKMRNAIDGGFWLLLVHAEERTRLDFEMTVLRINSDGTVGTMRKEKNPVCSDRKAIFDLDFFEKEGYEVCYYYACTWPKSHGKDANEYNLKFRSKCFVDENQMNDG